jgi:hypothetical protein
VGRFIRTGLRDVSLADRALVAIDTSQLVLPAATIPAIDLTAHPQLTHGRRLPVEAAAVPLLSPATHVAQSAALVTTNTQAR